jgi:hypothetical protein
MASAVKYLDEIKDVPIGQVSSTIVTAGAGFDEKGDVTVSNYKAVCHRFFSEALPNTQVFATVWGGARIRPGLSRSAPACETKAGQEYLRWFITDSPYSGYFIGPYCEDLDYISRHGVILSSDMPYAFIQNILIGTRALYEIDDFAIEKWLEVYQETGSGLLAYAFILGCTASSNGGAMIKKSAHRIHQVPSTIEEMLNVFDGLFPTLPCEDKSFFSEGNRNYYGGQSSVKTDKQKKDAGDAARHVFQDIRPDLFEKPKIVDPFAPVKDTYTKKIPDYDSFMKEYLPALKTILDNHCATNPRTEERKDNVPTSIAA